MYGGLSYCSSTKNMFYGFFVHFSTLGSQFSYLLLIISFCSIYDRTSHTCAIFFIFIKIAFLEMNYLLKINSTIFWELHDRWGGVTNSAIEKP